MGKEADAKSGLLGKVAKFIKNPTTDWADIDRGDPPNSRLAAETASSRLALKEAIKRKRLNDFVRKREFNMLRKIRRKEATPSEALSTMELASSYSSTQLAHDAEKSNGEQKRERTLRQINEIEAQLSHSWFHHKPDEAPTIPMNFHTEPPQPAPAASSAQPAEPSAPASVAAHHKSLPNMAAASDFAPTTLPLDMDVSQPADQLSDTHAQGPLMPELAFGPAPVPESEPPILTQTYQPEAERGNTGSLPPLSSRKSENMKLPLPWRDPALNGLSVQAAKSGQLDWGELGTPPKKNGPVVPPSAVGAPKPQRPSPAQPVKPHISKPEPRRRAAVYENPLKGKLEVATLQQDPEIEEAAISFASGDEATAELMLLKLIGTGSKRHQDVEAWLTLFDLYRATGKADGFDDLAPEFITLFGRSAPQWEQPQDEDLSGAQDLGLQTEHEGVFTWVSPSQLNTNALAALNDTVKCSAPPWRIDWRAVSTVKPDALPQFNTLLTQWADTPTQLQFLGGEQLLAALSGPSPTGNKSVNPAWWRVRLALLRLMDAPDLFDQTALDYCTTYEISPPAWAPSKCNYTPLTSDDLSEVAPANEAASAPRIFAPTTISGELLVATGVFKAALEGEILNSADRALAVLPKNLERIRSIDFDCRALRRVDFGAAGELLNWSLEQQGQSRTVTFRDVHRLVAAFFSVMGVSTAAQVVLRRD
ncbi:MAG: hypothetical protein LBU72_03325 [Burkholderiaceae bacterium]|jgi:hypothetical protein|nr:hypothetical protein [Burkholderiaceae bacterium]